MINKYRRTCWGEVGGIALNWKTVTLPSLSPTRTVCKCKQNVKEYCHDQLYLSIDTWLFNSTIKLTSASSEKMIDVSFKLESTDTLTMSGSRLKQTIRQMTLNLNVLEHMTWQKEQRS